MAETVNRFRPAAQQRGEDTRRRILDAALELFAEQGFEGASTRTLADRAGVNLPAIQYYFGSKEGLYRAVVQRIQDHIVEEVAPVAARIQAALDADTASPPTLVALLCEMLDLLIRLMLDDSVPDRTSRQKFFARMEVEPNAATDALQESMVHHVMTPCAGLVGRLVGRPADDEHVLLRAMTLLGQAKIFCGWGTDCVLRWNTIGEERVRAVQATIRGHVEAIFLGARA